MNVSAFVEQIEKLLSNEGVTRNQQRGNKHHFVLLHRYKHFKGPYNKVNLTCTVQAHGDKWPVAAGEEPKRVWVFFYANYTGKHMMPPLVNESHYFSVPELNHNAVQEFKKMLAHAINTVHAVVEKEREHAKDDPDAYKPRTRKKRSDRLEQAKKYRAYIEERCKNRQKR